MINLHDVKVFEQDWILFADFFNFFCGESLGYGTARNVYTFRPREAWAIKIMNDAMKADNLIEFDIWTNIRFKYPKIAKFLAPCHMISTGGKVMIQEKTEKLDYQKLREGKYKLPAMIPAFLADVKSQNWGFIGKRLVCHDYGNHGLYDGKPLDKMVKLKFWDIQ